SCPIFRRIRAGAATRVRGACRRHPRLTIVNTPRQVRYGCRSGQFPIRIETTCYWVALLIAQWKLRSADEMVAVDLTEDSAQVLTEPAAPDQSNSSSVTTGPAETVIRPPAGWQLVNVSELYRFRELLVFLIWRDVKIRYKQTVLGVAWAVLQP